MRSREPEIQTCMTSLIYNDQILLCIWNHLWKPSRTWSTLVPVSRAGSWSQSHHIICMYFFCSKSTAPCHCCLSCRHHLLLSYTRCQYHAWLRCHLPLSYTHCQLSAVSCHPPVSLAWHAVWVPPWLYQATLFCKPCHSKLSPRWFGQPPWWQNDTNYTRGLLCTLTLTWLSATCWELQPVRVIARQLPMPFGTLYIPSNLQPVYMLKYDEQSRTWRADTDLPNRVSQADTRYPRYFFTYSFTFA